MATDGPLLSLFKSQLEAECQQIATEHGFSDRGIWLIYWYFRHLHDFSDDDIEAIICEGGGDLGIDAIWIDDRNIVRFYQFKNPMSADKGIPAGDIDKTLAGLRVIFRQQHATIANPALKERVEEIYQQVRAGYHLHCVSSGVGIQHESKVKLNALGEEFNTPTADVFDWEEETLSNLQDQFYQRRLPAIEDPIIFAVPKTPYVLPSGDAVSYFLHATGEFLADLYDEHREHLLERNIRVDQKETPTNKSIEATCTGEGSRDFLHFNNGITFLCDDANLDSVQNKLTVTKAQVVNGGQTVRSLYRAKSRGALKQGVLVPVRVITSSGDKEFGNNVAVNQNNQNQMGPEFLRSNDPRVIQLSHELASHGWYLERREGEVSFSTPAERGAIEQRIGAKLDGRMIRLRDGSQAYTATWFGNPELAKKNVKKIFASVTDGGSFEKIFSKDMTAEKVIIAHRLRSKLDDFVKRFGKTKRRRERATDWKAEYELILGDYLVKNYQPQAIDQVVPQCAVFVCGTIFRDFVIFQKQDPATLPECLDKQGDELIREHLFFIIRFADENPGKAAQSWPSLLKSNTFFNHVTGYIQGVRQGSPRQQAIP